MTWSKKHFEAIAEVIKSLDDGDRGIEKGDIMKAFIAMLSKKNTKFDEERFAEACGGAR